MVAQRGAGGRFIKKEVRQMFNTIEDVQMEWMANYEDELEPFVQLTELQPVAELELEIATPTTIIESIVCDQTIRTAEKIRRLFHAGLTVNQIKRSLNIRQAHAYTTLVHSKLILAGSSQAA